MSTLDRLALGVLLPSFAGPVPVGELMELLDAGLGGLCLFGSNTSSGTEALVAYTSAVRELRPDAVVAIDEEGGDVSRLHPGTGSPVPSPLALGTAGDLGLTRTAGRAIGLELAALGVNLDLAPVADVNSEPDNPVIGTRSFGGNAVHVAAHTAAWVEGLQSTGVAACVKHFPGHGATLVDSHVGLPVAEADLAVLRTRELVPFAEAVRAGVAAVMTAHVLTPAIDPDAPATMSAPAMAVLRDELGFGGTVVSDALDMAGATRHRGTPEAAVRALVAGVDLLCLGPSAGPDTIQAVRQAVVGAVAGGRLSEERLVAARSAVRALGRGERAGSALHRAPVGSASDAAIPEAMLAAARRAVVIAGHLPPLRGATVVRVDPEASGGWAPTRWGLAVDAVVRPGEPLPTAGPQIVQVRDAQRQPDVVATLATAPAGSVIVEWGWPAPAPAPYGAAPVVVGHGWAQPGAEAVRDVLRSAGWDR